MGGRLMVTPLVCDRKRLEEALVVYEDMLPASQPFDALAAAARAVLEAPEVWVCVEAGQPPGISNLPGGPKHCYFTGKKHLADCGWVFLVPSQPEETT